MRKQASILSFLLAFGLLFACLSMKRADALNSAASFQSGFEAMESHDRVAFEANLSERDSRDTEETIYGILGIAAAVAGLALWPRTQQIQTAA